MVNGAFETHRGRVINILTYAALLDWSDFNTVASTRVLTFLAAVATALTTLIVSKKWGVVSGAVFAYIIVEFANGHIGGVSSEMPGLIFGLLAFCFCRVTKMVRNNFSVWLIEPLLFSFN